MYINEIENLKDYLVIVKHKKIGTLKGILENSNLGFSLSAVWDNDTFIGDMTNFGRGFAKAIVNKISGYLTNKLDSTNIPFSTTYKAYKIGEAGDIQISFKVIPGLLEMNYNDLIDIVSKFILPKDEKGIIRSNLYDNSLWSEVKSGSDIYKNNLITLAIGRNFLATDLYPKDVNIEYSKNYDNEGKPLYINVSMTLAPVKAITAEEFKSWFKI